MTRRALLGGIGIATSPSGFAETLASLQAQQDPGWCWTVVVDGGQEPDPGCVAESAGDLMDQLTHLAAGEPRVRLVRGGARPDELLAIALAASDAEHICLLHPGDRLERTAVATFRPLLAEHPWLYTDEAWPYAVEGGQRDWRKPGYGPELLRSQPYAVRSAVLPLPLVRDIGGLDLDAGTAQWYDLVLRVTERIGEPGHVAGPFYLRAPVARPRPAPWIDAAAEDRCRVVTGHCRRVGIAVDRVDPVEVDGVPIGQRVVRDRSRLPRVSVVIPTRGAISLVAGFPRRHVVELVRSLLAPGGYPDLQILVVADADTPADVLDAVMAAGPAVTVLPFDGPFNFSRKCNIGALAADGDYLCFLNDDVEVIGTDSLAELVCLAREPGVGAVGAKLLFADGTLQHAGQLMHEDGPGHMLFHCSADSIELGGIAQICGERSGVTAACLVLSAALFRDVGGFWEQLPVNYNDVDLCQKVRAAGRRVLYTPHAVLHHFESQSRVPAVADAERAALARRWLYQLRHDPYVNPLSYLDPDPSAD